MRKCDFAHDIKSKHLQPLGEIARNLLPVLVRGVDEACFELFEEQTHGGVDIWLERKEVAHRVGVGNWAFQGAMDLFVLRCEYTFDGLVAGFQ